MNTKAWLKCLGVGFVLAASLAGCGGGDDDTTTTSTTTTGSTTSAANSANAANSAVEIAPDQSATPVDDAPKTDGRGTP